MKKCIVIPDSFKGTMSSMEVCEIMKMCILKHDPACKVLTVPIADGGEGTVDCFLQALSGEKIETIVKNPFMEDIHGFYGIAGDTAIIEMAVAAGLHLAVGRLNPSITTTYGVGQLIDHAVKSGCSKIILGLGGSCTNDGGAGMAAALGTEFFDADGRRFIPSGGNLSRVQEIDIKETKAKLEGIQIIAMCDIDNPICGENGASFIFAPQKGADEKTVRHLETEMQAFSQAIAKSLGKDVSKIKGAGAAGGMGAGVYAFLNAQLKQGIETVLDLVGFDDALEECDCVFTGEGKLDHQSFSGKVVVGVARRAKKKNVPVVAVVGTMEAGLTGLSEIGVSRVCETGKKRKNMDDIKQHCTEDLGLAMNEILEE